ncbi:MAG: bifunctional serine/threonine-protein kinase/formylglycine-generating enzyme family protein [Planctomycetes bacterium]|nr:bifunctional serine/threonine-protein kinase/formylglycine-generating enzyme family protein [Planctomycetota bacterium]
MAAWSDELLGHVGQGPDSGLLEIPASPPPAAAGEPSVPAPAPAVLTPGGARGPLSGRSWPGYEIGDLIGCGGMGEVYRALQIAVGRVVALKAMPAGASDPGLRARFAAEATAAARIDSPHAVRVHDSGEHDGRMWLAMEYVAGRSLAELLRERSPLAPAEAGGLALQAARGLAAAHAVQLVHRDIKPANLLLAADGTLKVADFGLVRIVDGRTLTRTGMVLGTPQYLAPEQGRGLATGPAGDVYSLGAVLYELLTGRPPFDGDSADSLIFQHNFAEPVLPARINPDVPQDLQAVCLLCLQKDPARRYRDGAALAFTLPRLEPGCYGVRVSYRNPGADELRLTLAIDGGQGAGLAMNDGRTPDALPLYLPPGGAETATVSVLRSVQADSRALALRCAKWKRPAGQAAGWDDHGGVEILAVELVRVQLPAAGAAPAAWGELVDIPAGRFVRGGPGGAPDELPARELAVPAFSIGRHEVTNAEFERFRPDHRRWRDGYSWRDREPVIYVSWKDSAGYCNWLSAQHRLTPAYDEKTWAIDPAADGFRLPSEAEWEYVASGRGENRRHPWGDEAPRPGVHGNFELERALALPGILRSQCEEGTVVVGSYPAGASRDGVMDLAGNVAEWCSDTYALTTPEGLLHTGEAHHRAIRGGSWGYYNGSQRCRDREFNNAGYGGYIYIGFRVAIPATGAAKLAGR